ncbi:MAG: hypothetical protein NTV73_14475 [Hyphomicrobiales bacterium]|nr:hypothetical protein [Hyphomicrobiales bacterium]
MADTALTSEASSAGADRLEEEVARLKREMANLKQALAERADDIVQGAASAAHAVVQPVRNNPGTFGLIAGGLLGLLVGLAIGEADQRRSRHWYDRYL